MNAMLWERQYVLCGALVMERQWNFIAPSANFLWGQYPPSHRNNASLGRAVSKRDDVFLFDWNNTAGCDSSTPIGIFRRAILMSYNQGNCPGSGSQEGSEGKGQLHGV